MGFSVYMPGTLVPLRKHHIFKPNQKKALQNSKNPEKSKCALYCIEIPGNQTIKNIWRNLFKTLNELFI